MEATAVFENVLTLIKSSNLNFHLEQSPFGARISLKKSVVRDRSGMPLKLLPPFQIGQMQKLENENSFLLAKNGLIADIMIGLKDDLKQLKDTSEDQLNILENKLKRSWNELKEKMDVISSLKKSIKNQIDENFKLKTELTKSGKEIKVKDKTIFKLENKMENLEENFKRNKEDSNTLKQEKTKYEKEIKHLKSSQLSSSLKPLNSLKVPGKSLKSPTPKSNQLEPNPLLSQTLEKNFQQVDLVSASTSLLSPLLDKQVAVVSASTTLLPPCWTLCR